MTLDLLIKDGTVVDGSGGPRYRADVGVRGGRIVEIGRVRSGAAEALDADGLVVAPGFIDGHTHMDAQIAWDPLGTCSCWHGVTSVIMGNCGFTLAPCRTADREWFARCLEAVEDIPTEAMLAGIDWTWESFPQYLDALERLPKGINYGAYIGHSALRMYAMGERALAEPATGDEIDRMQALVREALEAGAIGFSTSRTHTHVTPDGAPVASRVASWDEIDRLVGVLGELNAGILEIAGEISTDREARRTYLERLQRLAIDTRRPVTFGTLATRRAPGRWTRQTDYIERTVGLGGRMFGQAATRTLNVLFSFRSNMPFDKLPAWRELRALPLEEQLRRLRDPAVRERLIADEARMKPRDAEFQGGNAATHDPRQPDYANLFAMRGVDWDDPSLEALAAERGQRPIEVMLDLAVETGLDQFFLQPLANEIPDDVLGLLKHPRTVATFSDSGAHVGQEMGSSLQTHLLSYWVREHRAFTLEEAVRMLTFDIASAWELPGRGLVRTGFAADLVVFDPERVKPRMPTVESDLPGGARRLVQKADGIAATVVNGRVAIRDGKPTGALSGKVLRGPLAAGRAGRG